MQKIRYAFLSTVGDSIVAFMRPYFEKFDPEKYDITIISTFTPEQYQGLSRKYRCIDLQLERGFHLRKTIQVIWKLYKEFRSTDYQVIEYATANVSLGAAVAGWLARVPVRLYNHWGALFAGYTGNQRFIVKNIERFAALFSTDIRQVSQRNLDLCIQERLYPRSKVKVLGFGGTVGVDFSRFDLDKKADRKAEVYEEFSIPSNASLFGFVGRINQDKGINELIEAFQKISSQNSAAYLMLVGNIDKNKPIKEENMRWAQQSSQVIFTGPVSDVPKYMSAFDVLVHPTYREGFGMVLQEAAALKVPIITTDIIGPGEFIQRDQTGLLVPAKDSDKLRDAMLKLLEDSTQRNTLAEKCHEYTRQNFERQVMVGRIINDREDLLKKRGII